MTDAPGADGPVSPTQVTPAELGRVVRGFAIAAGIIGCLLLFDAGYRVLYQPNILVEMAKTFATTEQVQNVEKRMDSLATRESIAVLSERISSLTDAVKSLNDRLQYLERVRNETGK
jgi:hypothetical protein